MKTAETILEKCLQECGYFGFPPFDKGEMDAIYSAMKEYHNHLSMPSSSPTNRTFEAVSVEKEVVFELKKFYDHYRYIDDAEQRGENTRESARKIISLVRDQPSVTDEEIDLVFEKFSERLTVAYESGGIGQVVHSKKNS